MPDLALPVVVVRDQAAAAGALVCNAPAALARRVDLPTGASAMRSQGLPAARYTADPGSISHGGAGGFMIMPTSCGSTPISRFHVCQ